MPGKTKAIAKSFGMILICIAMLFTMSGYVRDTWSQAELSETVTTAQPSTEQQTGIDHEPWDMLISKYKDTVGYLKVPGTTIDEVLVQYTDNDYYLRKSPVGDADEYYHQGCYFADYRCAIDLCQNTIIYGHNLADESIRFGQLEKYRRLDFYKQNPVIYFDTPGCVGKWKIVAVFMTNADEADGVKFYYRDRTYQTQETFLKFIERCRRRSYIDCPVDVRENDRILTLSTCDYELNSPGNYSTSKGRFAVIARMVREGEDETVDVSQAKLNENPLLPEGWYKRYGGEMPYYDDEPMLSDQ